MLKAVGFESDFWAERGHVEAVGFESDFGAVLGWGGV